MPSSMMKNTAVEPSVAVAGNRSFVIGVVQWVQVSCCYIRYRLESCGCPAVAEHQANAKAVLFFHIRPTQSPEERRSGSVKDFCQWLLRVVENIGKCAVIGSPSLSSSRNS